jgi:hypothetical protein
MSINMNFIKNLLGGRPMKYEGCAFIDLVSGKEVNRYTDTLGRKWLANSAWSLFRMKR